MSTNDNTQNAELAAREATDEAVRQARELSGKVMSTLANLDRERSIYLGAMAIVIVFTLIFDMASFSVGTDYAVSETTAQAQRVAEAKLNSWSYSAFSSCIWGKLMWFAAVGAVASLLYGAVSKTAAAWVPLSQIGFSGVASLLMLLILMVGFPDLSAYDDATCAATLLGFWFPFMACLVATGIATKRLI